MLCILLYHIGNEGNKLFVFVFVFAPFFNVHTECALKKCMCKLSARLKN
jgi:hypothetical protein